MSPISAPISDLPAIRPALAGLAALVLLATIGPLPTAEAGARGQSKSRDHACCCGTTCRPGCCEPRVPHRGHAADPPLSAADIDDLVADDLPSCIGPMPCGSDAGAPPSLSSPRERPPALLSPACLDLDAGQSPLPSAIDPFRPVLPGDLPEEPPEPGVAVLVA